MAATNVMPHNRDAEMALLGCMLIDNETAADIVEPLKEEDFYQESNRYVLTAMKHVFSSRKPIDLVTLSDQLESEGTLEKAGGITYLTELAQITPSAANYKSYFDIVKRDSLSRKLIRASQQIIQACASSTDEKGNACVRGKIHLRYFAADRQIFPAGHAGRERSGRRAEKIRVAFFG